MCRIYGTYINHDRHKSQERRGTEELPKLTPARGSIPQDKLGPMRDGLTPVRISRKDLRRMSDEELNMRKSAVTHDATLTGWSCFVGFTLESINTIDIVFL